MAFSSFPDVFSWIENLPPIPQWKKDINDSMNLCHSCSSQPSLNLSIKNRNNNNNYFSLSIYADYNIPIFLWTSRKIVVKSTSNKLLDNETTSTLLNNFIQDVLKYSPNNKSSSSLKLPRTYSENNIRNIFNFSFLSLTFIICIYEAPRDLRVSCLNTLKDELASSKSREVAKVFMRLLGSNVEENWVRSVNLAITNWISEIRDENYAGFEMPSPLFSYSISAFGLWKVQFYSPVIAMDIEKSSGSSDDRLMFSLNNHQLGGVIQLNYKVKVEEKWIEVMVNTDNIRCDVNKLLSDTFMNERGAGTLEKHFPSRIALQITPTLQTNVISISVSKSTENPSTKIGAEKGIGASFEPPKAIGLNFSTAETTTISLKPWKFEQSVYGNSANLNWFLHDSVNGREVFSSKPSKCSLLHPKAWFKNRYSNAHRVFTRKGGVIFASDEYGESVSWKVDRDSIGKSMEWEIKGWIWLTYWPNKLMSLYTETRRLEFKENVCLTLV